MPYTGVLSREGFIAFMIEKAIRNLMSLPVLTISSVGVGFNNRAACQVSGALSLSRICRWRTDRPARATGSAADHASGHQSTGLHCECLYL